MNFGKSRARLSTENDKKITFSQVAGLQEEKRGGGRDCGFP